MSKFKVLLEIFYVSGLQAARTFWPRVKRFEMISKFKKPSGVAKKYSSHKYKNKNQKYMVFSSLKALNMNRN